METVPQKPEKPVLPKFPTDEQLNVNNNAKVDILINYIEEVGIYLVKVKEYISSKRGLNSYDINTTKDAADAATNLPPPDSNQDRQGDDDAVPDDATSPRRW
jgi:hypothetical protein